MGTSLREWREELSSACISQAKDPAFTSTRVGIPTDRSERYQPEESGDDKDRQRLPWLPGTCSNSTST